MKPKDCARETLFTIILLILLTGASIANGQTATFTYQGKLNVSGSPANGNYDFEFKLFDAASGGTQQGSTVTLTNIAVSSGVFTVQLDFGASVYTGGDLFLDI